MLSPVSISSCSLLGSSHLQSSCFESDWCSGCLRVDRLKGAFGVDADAGTPRCDFIDRDVRSKDANDLDLISGVQAFNEVSLLPLGLFSLAALEVAEVLVAIDGNQIL